MHMHMCGHMYMCVHHVRQEKAHMLHEPLDSLARPRRTCQQVQPKQEESSVMTLRVSTPLDASRAAAPFKIHY